MQDAWEYASGTPYIIVAVIDVAFDIDHEDLNQYKLWAPYDAAGAWKDSFTVDYDPRPPENAQWFQAHGTACLGYISAVTDNATGIAGIAPNCYFMPIKIYSDDYGTSDLVHEKGWKWAISQNADVISYSIGGGVHPGEQLQIQKAYQQGIAIFCAAGQTASTVSYPACLPETFAVGASDVYDNLWSESNRGLDLDILAPSYANGGVYNWTLDITGYGGYCPTRPPCCGVYDYICKMMGTSAAAPVAAGVAALALSHKPSLVCDTCNADVVYDVIRHSAEDEIHANDPPGYDTLFGWGRVNAARAILAVVRGDADNNGYINTADATYIIAYVMGGGPSPQPTLGIGDVDCSGTVNIADAVYIIGYIFGGGAAPKICYEYDY